MVPLLIFSKALFLAEPFSALDEHLWRKLQLQLMHVTHDCEEAFMLGDKLGIIIKGCLPQCEIRDDIYYRPNLVEVAKFLLNQNIFTGKVIACDDLAGY